MAPQIIDIPGVGEVEFPDTMSDADISVAAKKLYDGANEDQLVRNVKNVVGVGADLITGAAKGAASTAVRLGKAVHQIPGVSTAVDKLYDMAGMGDVDSASAMSGSHAVDGLGLEPQGTTQKIGHAVEQGAEYMIPVGGAERLAAAATAKIAPGITNAATRVIPRAVANAATSAAVAGAHGDDAETAALMGGAVPVAGELAQGAGRFLKDTAVNFVRAAVKPTVTQMKQVAGASREGINTIADRLAKFIIDRRLSNPAQAQAIIDDAEQAIQGMVGNQATDAATRAARYLRALRNSAARQGLGADDVATIEAAGQDLLNGRMGRDVVTATTTMQPSQVLGPNGRPFMVPVTTHQTTRALRGAVPADEALDSARASSRWSTRKSWGEQKGAQTEASKAVERAQRDAVKAAVPQSKPVFAEYSKAIQARDALERMGFRQGNRDVLSLPATVMGAGEVAAGKVPIMAAAVNWLRNNQLKAGMWSDALGNAIRNNDVQTVSAIMARLGVNLAADQPTEMEQALLSRVRPVPSH